MPEELPSSSRRPGEPEPPTSRAELRYPPGAYYRRIALGTVLPGAGLLGTRWKVLGWLLVLASLAVGVWVAVAGLAGRPAALGPRRGRAARAAAVGRASASWSVPCCGSAPSCSPPSSPGRAAAARAAGPGCSFAAVACILVAAPAALAVRYLDVQSLGHRRGVRGDGPSERRDVALADTAAEDPWADVPRVNTLLIGSDAGKDRWGIRTDSMMVVSTDTKTGDTLLIGIPRNLERVPVPREQPAARPLPQRLRLRRRVPDERHLDPRRGPPRPLPGRREPRPPVDRRRRRRDHRPRHRPVGRHQPARASGRWSTPWAGSTSTCSSGCASSATPSPAAAIVFTGDKERVDRARAAAPRRPPRALVRPLARRQRRLQPDAPSALRRRCADGAGRPGGAAAQLPAARQGRQGQRRASTSRASELPAWVDLALRIQKGGSIRSLPLTPNVVTRATPTSPRSARS